MPKWIVIDNFLENKANEAANCRDTIDPAGTDNNACNLGTWYECIDWKRRTVTIRSRYGRIRTSSPNPFWKRDTICLLGFLVDLKSAYRQLPLSPDDEWLSVITDWDHERGQKMFAEMWGSPFAAKAVVNSFNRCSRGIEAILLKELMIPVSAYFDDFTINLPGGVAEAAMQVVCTALDILRWPYEIKEKPSEVYSSLGVEFRTSLLISQGLLTLANPDKRKHELIEMIDQMIKENSMSSGQASTFLGKTVFASAPLFGRRPRVGMRVLRDVEYGVVKGSPLPHEAKLFLQWWKIYLCEAPPRHICMEEAFDPPLHLWTDGWQSSMTQPITLGMGAVLYDPKDGALLYFGAEISEGIVGQWARGGAKKALINQAEMFPALSARITWSSRMLNRRVTHYVDNNGVREYLIKGYSSSGDSSTMLGTPILFDAMSGSMCWFTRVPSGSNPADGPSRGYFVEIMQLGGQWCEPTIPMEQDVIARNLLPTFSFLQRWENCSGGLER